MTSKVSVIYLKQTFFIFLGLSKLLFTIDMILKQNFSQTQRLN